MCYAQKEEQDDKKERRWKYLLAFITNVVTVFLPLRALRDSQTQLVAEMQNERL